MSAKTKKTINIQLFPYGSPVTGKELIGRDVALKEILMNLRGGQHLLLAGPRRTGKSSIVLESLNRLAKEGFLTIYLDLSLVNTIEELSRQLIQSVLSASDSKLKQLFRKAKVGLAELIKNAEYKYALSNFEIVSHLSEQTETTPEMLKAAFDFPNVYAQRKKKKIIIAFDEFGDIKTLDHNLARILRAVLQHHQHCTYFFLGSQESILRQLFSDPKEPFFGFTKEVNLSQIAQKDYATYIVNKFDSVQISISTELSSRICEWMHTHPYYTKVLASNVYEVAILAKAKTITEEYLIAGYQKAFLQLRHQLEATWQNLGVQSRTTRQVLEYLAYAGSQGLFSKDGLAKKLPTPHIAQALRLLEEKGLIVKIDKGKYRFDNYFLREFLVSLIEPDYFDHWQAPWQQLSTSDI